MTGTTYIEDGTTKNYQFVGGITGLITTVEDGNQEDIETLPSKISLCYNTGEISGQASVGGIVGCVAQRKSVVEKCYNTGKVKGGISVAGISGTLGRAAMIKNCYNRGNIICTNYQVAGITAWTYNTKGEVRNCYNIGEITGNRHKGDIIGNNQYEFEIVNCPTEENEIKSTFVTNANSEENIWEINAGTNNGYPVLIGMN